MSFTKLALSVLAALLVAMSFFSCEEDSKRNDESREKNLPAIKLLGKKTDTTYLKILNFDLTLPEKDKPKWKLPEEGEEYNDEGAELTDSVIGNLQVLLKTSGKVNNRIPGTYLITYSAEDASGKSLASITRTVYVVESDVHFLNGDYNVTCSCTITNKDKTEVTTTTYTANVTTSSIRNNRFEVSDVNIGVEQRSMPITTQNNVLDMDTYFNPVNFHQNSFLSGTINPEKDGFIIESDVKTLLPSIHYKCRNSYEKQTP